ncbi:putative ABC transport system permease protein [Chitinophaga niastensis]|uniref:Putative ABC transport system permease protein n=1 Tax=Chitinophaga niastensis TaxID=536980 RepID=A0A2P8HP07_CHINA|nr:ABC transporter permease [Chitinophaga niastensis]PSL47962.1 putative ABC transport system permease protein [Chitinophaga niastensis]
MFRNYLKIAWRNLWRNKVFSFINVMGLTVGLTACFFIFLYVHFELSYDSFHTKGDRIYRLACDVKTPSEIIKGGSTPWPFAPNLQHDFPEVEAFTRFSFANLLVKKDNVSFQEENTLFADSSLFRVFDFKLVKGNPQTALKEKCSIVFSRTAAKKYFGDKDPIGQTLLLTGDLLPCTVTGIMEDMPGNSQIKADMLVSMSTNTERFNPGIDQQWGNFGAITFLLLKPHTNIAALEAKFPDFIERHNGKERKAAQMFYTLLLEPLKEVYLHSTRDGFESGSITNVYIFSVIAIFILFIACINFINLTTARSVERAKEIGIRKVVGATKMELIRQFIGECVLLCLIAFALTIILFAALLPMFNLLAGKTISTGIFENPWYIVTLLVAAIGIGLLAGFYPALVLSSFKPVTVLKGRFATGTKGIILRKGLVVTQFAISIALIIGTLVVYLQMNYMHSKDLGFNKAQMLVIDTHGDNAKEAFKQAISGLPRVQLVATSSSVPGAANFGAYSEIENKQGDMQVANLDLYSIDYDYLKQYQIKVVAGRAFSRDFGTDTAEAMIMNEAAVKLFGYASSDEAIGKHFRQWGRDGKIIGVIKNFHFRSLQEDIKPLTMRIKPNECDMISVNVASGNLSGTIAAIEGKWKALLPNRPFNYYFLDEFFDRQYRTEERFGKLFFNFAVLAIFISCLGLLGLASYSALQRTREIGIRKVMGASVRDIVNLLSKEFLKLVFISFLIATPVAWYFMHQWLQIFAYRISITWWVFAAAGIIALLIAIGTISFQAIKAALADPVKSMRVE